MRNGTIPIVSPSKHRLTVLGLAAFATLVVAATARANDSMYKTSTYGPNCSTSIYCQTDNSAVTYFRQSSLDASAKTNIATVLSQKYDPTDLTVREESPPSYTGGSETDIIYQVNPSAVPLFVDAVTWCDDPITVTQCDQHYVAFRTNSPPNGAINNAIACHETGHAIGLTHGTQAYPVMANTDPNLGCMAIPSPYTLPAHETNQINATY